MNKGLLVLAVVSLGVAGCCGSGHGYGSKKGPWCHKRGAKKVCPSNYTKACPSNCVKACCAKKTCGAKKTSPSGYARTCGS